MTELTDFRRFSFKSESGLRSVKRDISIDLWENSLRKNPVEKPDLKARYFRLNEQNSEKAHEWGFAAAANLTAIFSCLRLQKRNFLPKIIEILMSPSESIRDSREFYLQSSGAIGLAPHFCSDFFSLQVNSREYWRGLGAATPKWASLTTLHFHSCSAENAWRVAEQFSNSHPLRSAAPETLAPSTARTLSCSAHVRGSS